MNQTNADKAIENQLKKSARFPLLKKAGVVLGMLLLVFFIFYFWVLFPAAHIRIIVSGNSMMQTLKDGEVLYADTKATPARGDIVVIDVSQHASFSGDYIIKRVIATEGDAIKCENRTVYIRYAGKSKYQILNEEYIAEGEITEDFSAVLLKTGEIFVMGDNRDISFDSRKVGCFSSSLVVARIPGWSYTFRHVLTFFYNVFEKNNEKFLYIGENLCTQ